jgi:hypothetical protein
MPFAVYGQSEQAASNSPPPVSQELVPEGDFALKLVTVLKLGTASNEAQAEDMLSSVGIAPKNGWIADYPMTPIIIGELQNAVVAAAEAHKLSMEKDDALKAFQSVTSEFGLAVVPGSPGQYAENQPQVSPTVIDNYYYDEGPPVITYYPPPWDYSYMYAWVPYPFWWGGFFYTGFFCLHDFHRAVFVHGHRAWVTNHFTDPVSRQVFRINPNGRRTAETFRATNTSGNRGFNTSEARNGATSILNRGVERSRSSHMTTTLSTGSTNGNIGSPGTRGQSEGRVLTNPGNNTQSFTGRSNNWSQSSGRSVSTPNRSLSGSSSGSGSFTCTNCHGGSSSFGHSGGTSSTSFSGGSFSGAHSFGGFSGGHSFSGGGGGGFHGGGGHR